ncbi:MAG: BON domain-containing protein [Syntrophales bacterium]
MKRSYIVIHFFVVLMMITAFVACGAWTPKPESAGEYVDDSVITTKVKALLADDDLLKSFKISVKTYQGTVHLSGLVASQNAVDKAGQIAWSVKGVTFLRNDLIVK